MEVTDKIKICGLSRMEDIACVNECHPDYIGFVFAPSRRRVTPQQAKRLRDKLMPGMIPVGVFVDEKREVIRAIVEDGIIDVIQLHGHESWEDILWLKEKTGAQVIQAVSVTSREDIIKAQNSPADYLLLDQGQGGTGIPFDWSYIQGCHKPYFVAGGIHIGNIDAARRLGAYAIDVSGGVETEGVKDPGKIQELVAAVKKRKRGIKTCQKEDSVFMEDNISLRP